MRVIRIIYQKKFMDNIQKALIITIVLLGMMLGWIFYAINNNPHPEVVLTDEQRQDIAARLQAHRKRKAKNRSRHLNRIK